MPEYRFSYLQISKHWLTNHIKLLIRLKYFVIREVLVRQSEVGLIVQFQSIHGLLPHLLRHLRIGYSIVTHKRLCFSELRLQQINKQISFVLVFHIIFVYFSHLLLHLLYLLSILLLRVNQCLLNLCFPNNIIKINFLASWYHARPLAILTLVEGLCHPQFCFEESAFIDQLNVFSLHLVNNPLVLLR